MLGHATILRWRTALCVSSDRHSHEMKLLARFFRRPRVPQPRRVITPRRFLDMSNRPPYRGRTPGLARLPERLPSIHRSSSLWSGYAAPQSFRHVGQLGFFFLLETGLLLTKVGFVLEMFVLDVF